MQLNIFNTGNYSSPTFSFNNITHIRMVLLIMLPTGDNILYVALAVLFVIKVLVFCHFFILTLVIVTSLCLIHLIDFKTSSAY